MTERGMDIYQLQEYLPHDYPFMFIDRVLDIDEENMKLVALKNVTANEPFFPGHFPGHPVMPGVLLLEAMAQASAILFFKTQNKKPGDDAIFYYAGVDNARFKQPVQPGDQLRFTVGLKRQMKSLWKFEAAAHVDGKLCVSADLMLAYKVL